MSTVWKELLKTRQNLRPFRLRRTDIKCRNCLKPLSRPLVRFRFPEAVDYIGLPQGTFWLSRDDIYNNYLEGDNWAYAVRDSYPEELHVNPRDIFSGASGCEICSPIRENAVVTDWEHTLAIPFDSLVAEDVGDLRCAGVELAVMGGRQPLSTPEELQAALRAALEPSGWSLDHMLLGSDTKSLTIFWFAAVESFYHGLPLPQVVRQAAKLRRLGVNLAVIPVSAMKLVPDVPVVPASDAINLHSLIV